MIIWSLYYSSWSLLLCCDYKLVQSRWGSCLVSFHVSHPALLILSPGLAAAVWIPPPWRLANAHSTLSPVALGRHFRHAAVLWTPGDRQGRLPDPKVSLLLSMLPLVLQTPWPAPFHVQSACFTISTSICLAHFSYFPEEVSFNSLQRVDWKQRNSLVMVLKKQQQEINTPSQKLRQKLRGDIFS